jgi:hypothetical protein
MEFDIISSNTTYRFALILVFFRLPRISSVIAVGVPRPLGNFWRGERSEVKELEGHALPSEADVGMTQPTGNNAGARRYGTYQEH